jgi:hypothetical protein
MTPPTFRTGDNVEIIGPAEYGNTDHIGEKFKIETYHKEGTGFGGRDLYSVCGLRWYPASSLRLVEELQVGNLGMTIRPSRILVEIDVSGLSPIEAEKAFRTFQFWYGSTSTITPAHKILESTEEVEE